MNNPFRNHLNSYFETITDFKHTTNRLNNVLLKDVETYTADRASYFSGTALVIGDWSGPTDRGWKINFYTGIHKLTIKEQYASEIKSVLSREFGLAFAQCFEALERFLKNIAREKGKNDPAFKKLMAGKKYTTGESLKGGAAIFDLIKIAGSSRFKDYSSSNNHNFKFKELFTIFSEARHSIIHSMGQLNVEKIPSTKYYRLLFEHLFPFNKLAGDKISLELDHQSLNTLLCYLAEFGYQIFKIFSEQENYEWNF